ncbi:MAG TPA: alpha-ketoacid dehydrogenase subunit beta [Elusimicrobiales bacterium]|nr:alpha-ketoacid dehydrogenase subunit beta [Elusimicrobiales bacterium]
MPWTKVLIDKSEFENTLGKQGLRGLSYRQALLEAHEQLLEGDKSVIVLGEGVDDPGGVFGSTLHLHKKFGRERVYDTPIAENGLTGVAIGAAIAGLRPIFVHMRTDFLPMCMDQLANHAAKWNYMTGGQVNVPLVVRSLIGRGWGSAAQHAQALYPLFTHIPGLKVVAPATPYDAKGLLISAVKDGNPVMFFEHRWLYEFVGYAPQEMYEVPFGQGAVRRAGKDVTIVAVSLMVYEAVKAARQLEKEGIDAEIIDPRTLKPLDEKIILQSLAKTGRLVIADNAAPFNGFAAEVAAVAAEKGFGFLKAPVKRVCLPDTPVPASPTLEQAYYPGAERIAAAVRETLGK